MSACAQQEGRIPILKTGSKQPMPAVWIDADTGHKVRRIGNQGTKNRSFYFHNNPFVYGDADAPDKMVYYVHQGDHRDLYVVDLETVTSTRLTYRGNMSGEIVSPILREAFYQTGDSVFAVHVDSGYERLVYIFPEGQGGHVSTVNADGTMLAGTYAKPVKDSLFRANPDKSSYFNLLYEAKIPHTVFIVDLRTGAQRTVHQDTAWINHLQFAPTDPNRLIFSHEGPWHMVDRMWMIDVQTGRLTQMHTREMEMEIAGHEFFDREGGMIWYDLQKPRGKHFFLAGVNVETMETQQYQLKRDQWSIHFNQSPDRKTFAGDGGDSTQVAHARDGRWIYHFTPQGDTLISERLVNMQTHNYRPLEPNVHFSPDGQWIIFRSDLDGKMDIYAVEIKKSNQGSSS